VERLKGLLPVVSVYLGLTVAVVLVSGYYVPVQVRGGSMRPTLAHGDIVIVRRDTKPAAGSIALLRLGPTFVLHRVREVHRDGSLITRGDANPVDDFRATPSDDVSGEVVAVIPVGRMVRRWR